MGEVASRAPEGTEGKRRLVGNFPQSGHFVGNFSRILIMESHLHIISPVGKPRWAESRNGSAALQFLNAQRIP